MTGKMMRVQRVQHRAHQDHHQHQTHRGPPRHHRLVHQHRHQRLEIATAEGRTSKWYQYRQGCPPTQKVLKGTERIAVFKQRHLHRGRGGRPQSRARDQTQNRQKQRSRARQPKLGSVMRNCEHSWIMISRSGAHTADFHSPTLRY